MPLWVAPGYASYSCITFSSIGSAEAILGMSIRVFLIVDVSLEDPSEHMRVGNELVLISANFRLCKGVEGVMTTHWCHRARDSSC